MNTKSSAGIPAIFSDNSLTVMHDPEDIIPFIMFHTDRNNGGQPCMSSEAGKMDSSIFNLF